MVSGHPVGNNSFIFFGEIGITKDTVVSALFNGINHHLGSTEIHICYPEGQHISRIASLLGKIVFQAGCAFAVNYFIKINSHGKTSSLYTGTKNARNKA